MYVPVKSIFVWKAKMVRAKTTAAVTPTAINTYIDIVLLYLILTYLGSCNLFLSISSLHRIMYNTNTRDNKSAPQTNV